MQSASLSGNLAGPSTSVSRECVATGGNLTNVATRRKRVATRPGEGRYSATEASPGLFPQVHDAVSLTAANIPWHDHALVIVRVLNQWETGKTRKSIRVYASDIESATDITIQMGGTDGAGLHPHPKR